MSQKTRASVLKRQPLLSLAFPWKRKALSVKNLSHRYHLPVWLPVGRKSPRLA